jgi:hypothetical protein
MTIHLYKGGTTQGCHQYFLLERWILVKKHKTILNWRWWWSFDDNGRPPSGGDDGPLGGNGIPIIPYLTQFTHKGRTPTFMYECFAMPFKLMGKGMMEHYTFVLFYLS